MPWLSVQTATRLRVVCKALKALVREWPMPLKQVIVWDSDAEAALTCFPAAESLRIRGAEAPPPAEEYRLVELLRRHGGTLKEVVDCSSHGGFLISAVQAAALPNLAKMRMLVGHRLHGQILGRNLLGRLEEMEAIITSGQHVASLEPLRCLPRLRCLRLSVVDAWRSTFPNFITPSLKSLTLSIWPIIALESLLRELPSMLQASGGSLEEFMIIEERENATLSAEGIAALAQVLRSCSTTVKTLKLPGGSRFVTIQIRELVPCLTSCCDTLEVLHCHWAVFGALPPTGPVFPRLTELCLERGPYQRGIDSEARPLAIMINGRLPALASLSLSYVYGYLCGEGGGEGGVGQKLTLAFEAVASTLRRLSLNGGGVSWYEGEALSEATRHTLGEAVGKLRRLTYLKLDLFSDNRDYTALARGMAASGGCPELLEMEVHGFRSDSFIHQPSVIVPSVRDLYIAGRCTEDEALLLCCALVRSTGYKHRLRLDLRGPPQRVFRRRTDESFSPAVVACMRAVLCAGGISAHVG
jgi:hypothetical protein